MLYYCCTVPFFLVPFKAKIAFMAFGEVCQKGTASFMWCFQLGCFQLLSRAETLLPATHSAGLNCTTARLRSAQISPK